jgi:hypothetical protein
VPEKTGPAFLWPSGKNLKAKTAFCFDNLKYHHKFAPQFRQITARGGTTQVPPRVYITMELTERIAQLLEEKYATDEAFADCFTVDVELKPGQKLYVFADSDSGIPTDGSEKNTCSKSAARA